MWYVDGSFSEFSPFGDRLTAVWNLLFFFEEKKLWLDREIVPVSNSGFESAMLFSDMHWQTRLCKKKIILHTTCTRHRWGVISVGSISSFLIISIDVPFIAFQNVTEFHSSWTCRIYPCIIHYRMLLVLILHQFSATHSWNTTRFYVKNSFPVKDLDVGWRKLSSFLENEKKKILSSHQHTLVKFMYSSNLFALWQRPKTHKEYFSALKLFFFNRSLHVLDFVELNFFLIQILSL